EAWRARLHAVVPSMAYLDSAVRCHRWQQAAAGKHGSVIVTAARTRPEKPVQPFTHLEPAQAGRVFSGPGPAGADRAGAAAAAPSRARHLVPADPDPEGVHRSGPGRQAGPDRVRDQRLPGPLLRLRPVRAAVDPALPRRVPGAAQTAGPAARDLSS